MPNALLLPGVRAGLEGTAHRGFPCRRTCVARASQRSRPLVTWRFRRGSASETPPERGSSDSHGRPSPGTCDGRPHLVSLCELLGFRLTRYRRVAEFVKCSRSARSLILDLCRPLGSLRSRARSAAAAARRREAGRSTPCGAGTLSGPGKG